MNQKELAKRLAQRLKISERLAGFLVKAFAEEIAEALVRGEKVSLRNFGSFRVKRSASRKHPRSRVRVVFKPGKGWLLPGSPRP